MSLFRTASPHIARLANNSSGKDYVIGDIHGCLDAVNELLHKMKFDYSRDRLLCTGDLTHRGPNSLGCLQLLKEPWFYSVRGNHEENTMAALNLHFGMPTTKADAFYQLAIDGGLWLCELVAKTFAKSSKASLVSQALSEALYDIQNLPKVLLVGEGKEKYIVVHSFLLKNDKLSPEDPKFASKCLFTDLELEEIALGQAPLSNPKLLNESKLVGQYLKKLDSESRINNLNTPTEFNYTSKPHGSPKIFCGHTPLSKPMEFLGHIHIDTGAGKEDKIQVKRYLTAIDVSTGELFQAKASCPELKIQPKDYAKKIEKAIEKGHEIPPHAW
jgi:serine/threonine protein phosphatase 1